MIVRAVDLREALPSPLPDPALSPREALGERYATELLTAFQTIHEASD